MSIVVSHNEARLNRAVWDLIVDGRVVERFRVADVGHGLSASWRSLCCGAESDLGLHVPHPVCTDCWWGCHRVSQYVNFTVFREEVEAALTQAGVQPLISVLAATLIGDNLEALKELDRHAVVPAMTLMVWGQADPS